MQLHESKQDYERQNETKACLVLFCIQYVDYSYKRTVLMNGLWGSSAVCHPSSGCWLHSGESSQCDRSSWSCREQHGEVNTQSTVSVRAPVLSSTNGGKPHVCLFLMFFVLVQKIAIRTSAPLEDGLLTSVRLFFLFCSSEVCLWIFIFIYSFIYFL